MENKKVKKFKDNLPVGGKINSQPIKKKDFDETFHTLLNTRPPQKDKK